MTIYFLVHIFDATHIFINLYHFPPVFSKFKCPHLSVAPYTFFFPYFWVFLLLF